MSFSKLENLPKVCVQTCKGAVLADGRHTRRYASAKLNAFLDHAGSRYFEHDGYTLHFTDTGKGKYDRAALCLHSRYGWSYGFRQIVPRLKYHGFRVITLDLLGSGLSDKPDEMCPLSIQKQAARVQALIEHLDLGELTLIGHEQGASLAAQMPRLLPNSVDALILANPAPLVIENGWSGLHLWRTLVNAKLSRNLSSEILSTCPTLGEADLEAYCEPLNMANGTLAARHFHENVVLQRSHDDYAFVEAGYSWLKERWSGRHIVLAGTLEPVFGVDAAKKFCKLIGCKNGVIELDDVHGAPFEEKPAIIDLAMDQLFAA